MGTNFYCKRIPTKEQLNSIADLVVNENLDDAIKYVELHKGGIYDLCYETRDGTLFERRRAVY